tara:strand:+ start:143 stop:583 length:441 start_codon:yes stop_codon:yes gene_type:complete
MAVLPLNKVKSDKKKGKVISHNEVMNTYTTKKDVIRAFGAPTTKENFEGIEIWYYNKGTTTSSYSSGNAKTNLNSDYSGINARTNANARTTTNSYTKYVEFQFENDLVTSWRSKGLNYGTQSNWLGAYAIGFLIDLTLTIVIALQM